MKIRYFGDLHREFTNYQPKFIPSIGEDFVALAGDIGVGIEGITWAKKAFADRLVIYVLGNHEFYQQDFDKLITKARRHAERSNVRLLEKEQVRIGNLRIAGCTLWTDFRCFGEEKRVIAERAALETMADFELIRRKDLPLTPNAMAIRCMTSRTWLEETIAASATPVLVVTHHAPSLVTMNPNFHGDISNAAFHNSFDELFKPPVRAWIHGHNHYCWQKEVNGIPLVTNQCGYPREITGDFSWDRVIELDV